CVAPGSRPMFCGVRLTVITGTTTVTVAEADFDVSCTLVAVTVTEPAVAGAVKRPLVLTVPAVVVHVTALLVVPVTVAVNCCVVPAFTVGVDGEMVTDTVGTATVMFA